MNTKEKNIVLHGKATAQQIKDWKKETGQQYLDMIKVKLPNADNEFAVCYLKEPPREIKAKAMTMYAQKQIMETGEFVIQNCWLGGDERIKTDERISEAAAVEANGLVEFYETFSEKI